ncbi:glycoside hydrolase family 43 protein [soil metagenome]
MIVRAAPLVAALLSLFSPEVFADAPPAILPPKNPASAHSMADPSVLYANGALYCYSTSGCQPEGSYPIHRTEDGRKWKEVGHIFTTGHYPAWVGACDYWAPEVHLIGGKYIAHYSARNRDHLFCIGAAVSDSPEGPFTDIGAPLVCATDVGLIDASYFRDPVWGNSYVLWKEDGNGRRPKQKTPLVLQKVTPDGLHAYGEKCSLIINDVGWEEDLVEAPNIIYRAPYYYLFFSGSGYGGDHYGIGVARSREVEGGYEKCAVNPIVRSDEKFDGPGHCFLFEDKTDHWMMFYHARDRSKDSRARLLMMSEVTWTEDQWPLVTMR